MKKSNLERESLVPCEVALRLAVGEIVRGVEHYLRSIGPRGLISLINSEPAVHRRSRQMGDRVKLDIRERNNSDRSLGPKMMPKRYTKRRIGSKTFKQ